jgi:hypothetical protein
MIASIRWRRRTACRWHRDATNHFPQTPAFERYRAAYFDRKMLKVVAADNDNRGLACLRMTDAADLCVNLLRNALQNGGLEGVADVPRVHPTAPYLEFQVNHG